MWSTWLLTLPCRVVSIWPFVINYLWAWLHCCTLYTCWQGKGCGRQNKGILGLVSITSRVEETHEKLYCSTGNETKTKAKKTKCKELLAMMNIQWQDTHHVHSNQQSPSLNVDANAKVSLDDYILPQTYCLANFRRVLISGWRRDVCVGPNFVNFPKNTIWHRGGVHIGAAEPRQSWLRGRRDAFI